MEAQSSAAAASASLLDCTCNTEQHGNVKPAQD